MPGYENQLSVAKGCAADYIITYGNDGAAGLSCLTKRDISFCASLMTLPQHGGEPVSIATSRNLGGTDRVCVEGMEPIHTHRR